MPTKEEVMRFVQEVLDKSRLEDYEINIKAKQGKMIVVIDPRQQDAQELIDEV